MRLPIDSTNLKKVSSFERGESVLRVALLFVFLLGGCASVQAGGRQQTFFHLGATSVTVPQTQGDVSAISVSTLGIGWEEGIFLGWRSSNWITADPANCQLLIVIRSDVEAANAIQIINALGGQRQCIVDYTNTLRR